MAPFSGLGIGLSLVFGFLLLAFVAELYYLLWWKKRIINTESEEEDYRNHAKKFFHLLCWRRPTIVHNNSSSSSREPDGHGHEHDLEHGSDLKDGLFKGFGEEGVESELMRLHNLSGPPRFLFTIKEETKEDLETESVKSRARSLSDIVMSIDTPFLTPVPSPLKPCASPLGSYNSRGFNPLFESSETEHGGFKSSPPPTFKFLRDAEEKLYRRLKEETEKRVSKNGSGSVKERFNFVTTIVDKNELLQQVLPLTSSSSSPTTILRPITDQKPIVH